MKKKTPSQKKIRKVMREYSSGELHSDSKHGPLVTSAQQALAIGLSEARKLARNVRKK